MKITAINGSPKGKQSATYIMIEEFLKGAQSQGAQTSHILLSDMKIHHCLGCFSCWTKTPGVCVFKDDMQKIDLADSDLIIYATPLFVDNVSGLLKNFLDRMVFSAVPSMENDVNKEAVHPKKQKIHPKIMVMANCGFPGQSHFEVLKILFRRMARNCCTDLIAEIYRDEGPLLIMNDPRFEQVISQYKLLLQQAGEEIVQNLKISDKTAQALKEELIGHDLYLQNHNQYFNQFA
jgi:multimeric flavodoxin WrbA